MTAEQQARDMLEQCGVEDAQSFTAGDVVALANLIADYERLQHQITALDTEVVQAAVVAAVNTLGSVLLGAQFTQITTSPIPDDEVAVIIARTQKEHG